MNSSNLRVEPLPCAGLGRLAWALHVAAGLAPWAAGCGPVLAGCLSAVCLATLPATLAAVPGPRCGLRGLRRENGAWTAVLADGRLVLASVDPATRVFAGLVLCRVVAAGRRHDWWLPRHALPAGDFRSLKVALRCARPVEAGPS